MGPGKLYLFVKDLPKDGKLRLPGVVEGTRFGAPYLLGADGTHAGEVAVGADGAVVEAAGLLQGRGVYAGGGGAVYGTDGSAAGGDGEEPERMEVWRWRRRRRTSF